MTVTAKRAAAGLLAIAGILAAVWNSGHARTLYALLFFQPPGGLSVPFDQGCEVESYRAGQGSELGALAIRSCRPRRPLFLGRVLEMSLEFDPKNPDLRQGEVWFDLDSLGRGKWIDLAGGRVEALLVAPRGISSRDERARYAGSQIIVEAEDYQGHRHKLYGDWHDLTHSLRPESVSCRISAANRGAHRDPGFLGSEHRIRRVGLKLALNTAARRPYRGAATLAGIWVYPPDAGVSRRERERARRLRDLPGDHETLARLGPLKADSGAGRTLPGRFETGNTRVRSVAVVSEPRNPARQAYRAEILFPEYRHDVEARSARLVYRSGKPLSLHGKTLKAWVAVGPRLRGFSPRAHIVQFELWDAKGTVLRGPASDLSSGIRLDSGERESESVWVPVEVRHDFTSHESGFRWDQVARVGVRFLAGKFADEFYGGPIGGTLLISGVRVLENPHPPEKIDSSHHRPPVRKPPVPVENFKVGVNYDYVPMYGYSAGMYPYGGRNRCGFSSPLALNKLHRDFARFAANGIRLVRVWLFADMRAGLEVNAAVVTPDPCVSSDLDALFSAIAAHPPLECIPVLLDFYAADGGSPEKQAGNRSWREGEYPELLTQQRRLLVDGFRPIIRRIAGWNREQPGLIYAVDLFNEPENATGVMQAGKARQFQTFIREMRDMIWSEAPGLKVTLGSRNRRDMARLWDLEDRPNWIWQYHFYDGMEQEDGLPLDFSAGRLGLRQPVILGEVEPSNLSEKLDTIHRNGYDAALFWSANELDGYRIDLTEIRRWLENRKSR